MDRIGFIGAGNMATAIVKGLLASGRYESGQLMTSDCREEQLNKISDPVKGNIGYYLIKIIYRTPFDSSSYAVQKNSIRDNLLRQKKSSFFNDWIAELRKNADITDKRYMFYNR